MTNIRPDYDAFWDFVSLRPESTHQTLQLFTDRGIPASHRTMHGYGANTYSLINSEGTLVYCKFHWKSNQGKTFCGAFESALFVSKLKPAQFFGHRRVCFSFNLVLCPSGEVSGTFLEDPSLPHVVLPTQFKS